MEHTSDASWTNKVMGYDDMEISPKVVDRNEKNYNIDQQKFI